MEVSTMLEVRVHSTETGKDAYIELEVRDEEQAIDILRTVGFAQALGKMLQED
jgi:hypothetical protein